MASSEIDSFVLKFKNLQYAGLKASLTLETENGESIVTLRANLGYLPPPNHHGYNRGSQVNRPPAYFRRQERRKAARVAAEEESVQAEQAQDSIQADDIKEVSSETDVCIVAEKATDESEKKEEAEEAIQRFECEICDFQSNWQNGLNVHMSRKHSRIDQLDGHATVSTDDEKYAGSKHYWMKGWLGGAYQSYLDAYDTIENCDFSEDEKNAEKIKLLDARKAALGDSYLHFPPWDKY